MRWVALRQLWSHRAFRRLLVLRVLAQGGDIVLSVGMGAYILFTPQSQPTGWAIAGILAVTLLPFSLFGPFIAPLLDRWPRRNIAICVDTVRILCALTLTCLVLLAPQAPWSTGAFFALLLVALSLNRFLLAGLSAALPQTVGDQEYLAAHSVMPLVGPFTTVLGGIAMGTRLILTEGAHWPSHHADAVVFFLAAVLFAGSVLTSSGFPRDALGPSEPTAHRSATNTARALARTVGLLATDAFPAGMSLALIFCQRVAFGLIQVATILLFRNRLNNPAQSARALADLGLWMGAGAIGFLLASAVAPTVVRVLRMRWAMVAVLVATAAVQLFPGTWFARWPLIVAGMLLGVLTQSIKIMVDGVVQGHVSDQMKGTVFVVYDMLFNVAFVLAAVVGALILPTDGASVAVFVGVAALYVVLATGFAVISRPYAAMLDRGAESVTRNL